MKKKKHKKVPGSGRAQMYGEPTKVYTKRVPISKEPEINDMVEKKLKTYKVKKPI